MFISHVLLPYARHHIPYTIYHIQYTLYHLWGPTAEQPYWATELLTRPEPTRQSLPTSWSQIPPIAMVSCYTSNTPQHVLVDCSGLECCGLSIYHYWNPIFPIHPSRLFSGILFSAFWVSKLLSHYHYAQRVSTFSQGFLNSLDHVFRRDFLDPLSCGGRSSMKCDRFQASYESGVSSGSLHQWLQKNMGP